MTLFDVVLTIVALLAVAALILLFERKRAEQIERDTAEMARQRRQPPTSDDPPAG